MLHRILIGIFASLLFACSSSKNTPSQIGLRDLDGYELRNPPAPKNNLECRVVSSQQAFEYLAQATSQATRQPQFTGQAVLVVISDPADKGNWPQFESANVAGSTMNVYFKMTATDHPAEKIPFALATVPRVGSVKRIQFYKEKKLVQIVDIRMN
jgi:hypothetical protein